MSERQIGHDQCLVTCSSIAESVKAHSVIPEEKREWVRAVENCMDTANLINAMATWKGDHSCRIAAEYSILKHKIDYCRELKGGIPTSEVLPVIHDTVQWLGRKGIYGDGGDSNIGRALQVGRYAFENSPTRENHGLCYTNENEMKDKE